VQKLPSKEKREQDLKRDKLSVNQQKFIDNLAKTGNQTRSYMDAYNNDNENTSAGAASVLIRKPKINAAFQEKLKELEKLTVLTVEQRRLKLSEEAINGAKASDRIKAVDVLNKMEGIYIDKIEADTTVNIDIAGAAKEWAE